MLFACETAWGGAIITWGASKTRLLLELRRRIALICALYDFNVRAVHLPGAHNVWANLLSRLVCDPESESIAADLADLSFLSAAPLSLISDPIFRDHFSAHSDLGLFRSVDPERHLSSATRSWYYLYIRDLAANLLSLDAYARHLGGTDACRYGRPPPPGVPRVAGVAGLCSMAASPSADAPGAGPACDTGTQHSDAGRHCSARLLPCGVVKTERPLQGLQQGPAPSAAPASPPEARIPLTVVDSPNPSLR